MTGDSDRSMEVVLAADIAGFERELRRADAEISAFSRKAERGLAQVDRATGDFNRSSAQSARVWAANMRAMQQQQQALAGLKGAFLGVSAAMAALGSTQLINGVVQTSASFEKLRASLKTVTGSAAAGAAAFEEIKRFAGTTPFSVAQATEAFIKLKALGLDPSMVAMESYGNTASAMGKDLMQWVEAIADATTGEFERLKEFGVKASKSGDDVAFTFQGVTTTVRNSADEVERYLRRIGTDTFAGAMREQMQGLNGALSALDDQIQLTADAIGRGGLSDAISRLANDAASALEESRASFEGFGGALGSALEGAAGAMVPLARNADMAAIALAAVFAGRTIGAVTDYVQGTMQAVAASRANAAAALEDARAQGVNAVATLRAAQARRDLAVANGAAAGTLARLNRDVGTAERAVDGATASMARWSDELAQSTVRARAANATMSALRGTLAFFGGPIGLGITAITAGVAIWATRTSETETATQSLEAAVRRLREAYGQTGAEVEKLSQASRDMAAFEVGEALKEQRSQLESARAELNAALDVWRTAMGRRADRRVQLGIDDPLNEFLKQGGALRQLADDFDQGRIGIDQFRDALARLGSENSGNAALVALVEQALRTTTQVADLERSVRDGEAALNLVQGAAGGAGGAIAGAGNAAAGAAGQFAGAAAAVDAYAASMRAPSAALPGTQAAIGAQEKLAKAREELNKGLEAAAFMPDALGASQALMDRFEEQKREITGVAGAYRELMRHRERHTDRQDAEAKERAAAQIRRQFEERAEGIRALVKSGAQQAEIDDLLAKNSRALEKALGNSAAAFEDKGRKAGGAGKKVKDAVKSVDDYRRLVERTAQQEMPWLRAAEEAQELREALAALIATGEDLPPEYVIAVRARIDELEQGGVLSGLGADMGRDFGDAFSSGFGDVFRDLMEGGFDSFDELLDKVTSKFADIGYQNIDRLFSGEAFKDMGSALKGSPGAALTDAVEAGAMRGTRTGAATGIFGALAQGGAGGLMSAGGQALGGALGAFSMGYQSGSPLMGGLGGALSGLSAGLAFGPVGGAIGALVGGGLGLFGGILGGNAQAKQKRLQAQRELATSMGAINQFKQMSAGRGIGEFRDGHTEYTDQSVKYQIMARDAGNKGLQRELEQLHSQYFALLEKTFRKERDVALGNLNLGFGFDTAFFDAVDNMEQARDQLTGWVDDARYMFDRLRDYGNDLDPDAVNTYISEMEHAAQRYAISLVTGVEPMSDVAERINEIKGSAVGLEETLIRLAMSADEAAASVDHAVKTAMDKLRGEFADEIRRSINDLTDQGYINQLNDAVKTLGERLADTKLLGLDSALALEEFDAAIASITKGAADSLPAAERAEVYRNALKAVSSASGEAAGVVDGLLKRALESLTEAAAEAATQLGEGARGLYAGIRGSISGAMGIGYYSEIEEALTLYNERLKTAADLGFEATGALRALELSLGQISATSGLTEAQLEALAEVFPAVSDTLRGLIGAGGSNQVADARSAADQARAALRAAYEAERSELEQTIATLGGFAEQIKAFRTQLRLDAQLSPLSPLEKLQAAAAAYQDTLAKVGQGDKDALGRLEQVSRDYLNEARAYYGSTEAYTTIWQSVDQQLAAALASAETQVSAAEQQLATLKTQVGALIDINDSVLSVGAAITGLNAAMAALASAEGAQAAAIRELAAMQAAQNTATIQALYQSLLGRQADAGGLVELAAASCRGRLDQGRGVGHRQLARGGDPQSLSVGAGARAGRCGPCGLARLPRQRGRYGRCAGGYRQLAGSGAVAVAGHGGGRAGQWRGCRC
ncbi:tape measure protein [Pannonibacter sp. SL95]|nr:tape measure protein [Pannonibacter sp. SL95]MCY1707731.1 tape measure protein [Pannonibacter sp. SL95]